MIIAIVIGLALILAAAVVGITNPLFFRRRPVAPRPEASAERLQQGVRSVIQAGRFRTFTAHDVLGRAADAIRSGWQGAGFEVTEQPFEVPGIPHPYRNLMITYGPSQAPRLVVGAHYDVCGEQDGADDNASSIAVLLELARMLRAEGPVLRHRIDLVAYCLEEPPFFGTHLMGSAIHARSLREVGAKVHLMLALEMLGYFAHEPGSQRYPIAPLRLLYPGTGDFIAIVGRPREFLAVRRVKALMAATSAIPVRSVNAPAAVPGVGFSDHLSYWNQGYPAVMITDTAFYRNPHYHQPSDTIETLDFKSMAEVTRGVYAALTRWSGL